MKNLVENFKILSYYPAVNARYYKVLEMYKDALLSICLIKHSKFEFIDNRAVGRLSFKWEEEVKEDAVRLLRCQQLEDDLAEWNSLETEIMGGQGFTAGCSAVRGMEWHGMEWKGMEGNGMEWHGMEWHGMEWHGREWHGMEWHGMEWNGMEWNGMTWDEMEWRGMEWHGMEWHGMEWNGME